LAVEAGLYSASTANPFLVTLVKEKSALMIFDKHANLKYKFGNRHFWAEGYYVSTVGLNEAIIKKYIEEQEKHDIALDKLSTRDKEDPFRGGK
jgi:putative transposase